MNRKEVKGKTPELLPDPIERVNANLERLCDLLETLVDSRAMEVKAELQTEHEKKELGRIAKEILHS